MHSVSARHGTGALSSVHDRLKTTGRHPTGNPVLPSDGDAQLLAVVLERNAIL